MVFRLALLNPNDGAVLVRLRIWLPMEDFAAMYCLSPTGIASCLGVVSSFSTAAVGALPMEEGSLYTGPGEL